MATRTVAFRHDEIRTNPNGYIEADITSDRIRDLYRSVIHAEHVETRDGVVDDLIARVESGDIADYDALSDAIHEACDGVLIYTSDIREYLSASDNENAYSDNLGEASTDENEPARAAFALAADVREELDARGYGYNGDAWDDSDDTDAEAPADATV